MDQPLPCPNCGNDQLYLGPHCSDSMTVHCQSAYNFIHESLGNHLLRMGKVKVEDLDGPEFQGCGLRMIVQVPDEFPESMLKKDESLKLPVGEALKQLREITLAEAIKRWNIRQTTPKTKSATSN